jgi:ATP-dependent RNA helicase DHX37/DHR1
VEAAFKKVKKIHQELPPGGVLVFLTGKKEILYVCKRLKIELKRSLIDSEDETEIKSIQRVKILPLYS